ncbi:protein phosphatase 2A regulatory subunit PR55 [Pelomyxa schiedti]|nr:protein phosphatase 2A regulatory subunit PR55 [Pelomyxa schiedti]
MKKQKGKATTSTTAASTSSRKRQSANKTVDLDDRSNKSRRTVPPKLEVAVTAWFEKYRDPLTDSMGPSAIQSFCEAAKIDPAKVEGLILSWKLEAGTMGLITRDQFVNGLMKLDVSTGPALKKALENMWREIQQDPEQHFALYRWAFPFCAEGEAKKHVDAETATQMLMLVLPQSPYVASFAQFVKDSNIKFISRDQWLCFWEFSRQIKSMDDYNKNEAWPIMFDDFVDYTLEKKETAAASTTTSATSSTTTTTTTSTPPKSKSKTKSKGKKHSGTTPIDDHKSVVVKRHKREEQMADTSKRSTSASPTVGTPPSVTPPSSSTPSAASSSGGSKTTTGGSGGSTPAKAIMEWRLNQVFGGIENPNEPIPEADIVSAVQFDCTGEYLAAGDKGGRIVMFKRDDTKDKSRNRSDPGCKVEFKFCQEFQSHVLEFDYLKSMDIEEKINKIRFLHRRSEAHHLLTTNDKTIKLWKVFERKPKNFVKKPGAPGCVQVPHPVPTGETVKMATARSIYSNAHNFHVHSISVNSDQETFLSADDLRINLWNLTHSDQTFNIVDIKPSNLEELSEVITCAEFHPSQCSLFAYSTSKGVIRLGDLRQSSLCDPGTSKVFEQVETGNRSFFADITVSISDLKFSLDGRYMVSRDFMTLKLWDINMESHPVKVVHVHDYLKAKLAELYESESIFDKFDCAINGDSSQMMTGSYGRLFRSFEINGSNDTLLHANRVQPKPTPKRVQPPTINADSLDLARKVMHLTYHPSLNLMAVTCHNNLFIFTS